MVNKNLVEAINKLIKNISEDYANEVLCDIINNDRGLLTVGTKYRIEEFINEINEVVGMWNIEQGGIMEKKILEEIIKGFKENERTLEDNAVKIDGDTFGVTEFDDGNWEDEGKYQYNTESGRLCRYDNEYSVVEKYDIYIELSITRSGSYFSDYYYEYDNVRAYEIKKVLVPEVIIPEHYEDEKDYIKF